MEWSSSIVTMAEVVWSVCTSDVCNVATVREDGLAIGKGCWPPDTCIKRKEEVGVTCGSCYGTVVAFWYNTPTPQQTLFGY